MSNKTPTASFAEINLTALEENLLQVQIHVGHCPILAVVKANAYGHGAVRVAQFLSQSRMKVAIFGVAFLEEGVALREAGITAPILLLTGAPSEQTPDVMQYDLTPVVFDVASLKALNQHAVRLGRRVKVHLKIDTGMGRIGISPEKVLSFFEKALSYKMISVEGILTHFAEADLCDLSFAQKQLSTIQQVLADLKNKGIVIPFCHLANSAAILHFKPAHLDLVRPGLMLYGYSPLQKEFTAQNELPSQKENPVQKNLTVQKKLSLKEDIPINLKPVMQVKARIIALKTVPAGTPISYGRTFVTSRKSRIATVGIGYADGYPFALSNCGRMIVKGALVPVAGRVCMDMTMLDVTEAPALSVGDWVTVIGAEGEESVWADRLARWAKTHPYEILCGIGSRVERRYTAPTSSNLRSFS